MRIGGYTEQIGERCPVGPQVAVLAGVYDIGEQEGFEGKVQHKIVFWWESGNSDTKGRPFTLPDVLTASSHEKATLTARWTALMGRAPTEKEMEDGYDTDSLIGKSCLVMVEASKKQGGWPRITNVMPLPKGMPAIKATWKVSDEPKFVVKMRARSVTAGGASHEDTHAEPPVPASGDDGYSPDNPPF